MRPVNIRTELAGVDQPQNNDQSCIVITIRRGYLIFLLGASLTFVSTLSPTPGKQVQPAEPAVYINSTPASRQCNCRPRRKLRKHLCTRQHRGGSESPIPGQTYEYYRRSVDRCLSEC